MWKQIQVFFAELGVTPVAKPRLEIAAIALLIEVARADNHHTREERQAIAQAATEVFGVQEPVRTMLIEEAARAVEESISLFDFTRVLNEGLDRDAKYRLLECLWQVAYADGNLDTYEEYYLRKIGELLHLSHRDLIRAKLAMAPG